MRFGDIVAPPAMLQTWTMPRPRIEGIRERGGAPGEIDPDTPVAVLAAAGFKNVYNIVDGVEGDLVNDPDSPFDGKRIGAVVFVGFFLSRLARWGRKTIRDVVSLEGATLRLAESQMEAVQMHVLRRGNAVKLVESAS